MTIPGPRLEIDALALLPELVARPTYPLADVRTGIVHLGMGRFHRAHQAAYADALMNLDRRQLGWGICGVSLQSSLARDRLASQGCLYTLGEAGEFATGFRVIGSVRDALFAPEMPETVINRIARPETRILSLTITEKGYCRNPATGGLALPAGDPAQTALGWIARGLEERARIGSGAITLMSCDDLPANGRQLRRLLLEFCAEHYPRVRPWVEANASFPSSMADRIVPALDDESIEEIGRGLGYEDRCLILTEPFSDWVVEDDFREGRPPWERVGARFCNDVEPFEAMKQRLLDGSHSALAYLGSLAGFETVSQAIAFAPLKKFVDLLMHQETGPTLQLPPDIDLKGYQASILKRFGNPALRHRLSQLAADGSQRLPSRLLAPARERLETGQGIRLICLAIAGWIAFVARAGRQGSKLDDPLADRLLERARRAGDDPASLARELLASSEIFGFDTPDQIPSPMLDEVRGWLAELGTLGAKRVLEKGFGA